MCIRDSPDGVVLRRAGRRVRPRAGSAPAMIDPKLLALGTAIAFGLAPVILKMAFRRGGSPGTGMIVGLVVAVPVYLATSDGHLDPGPSRVLGCPLRLSSAHLRRVVD